MQPPTSNFAVWMTLLANLANDPLCVIAHSTMQQRNTYTQ